MFDLFADIFTFRQNALVKADPRVKLLAALWAILLVLFSSGPSFPLVLFLVSVIALLLLRVPAKVVALRLLIPFGMVFVIMLLKLFMTRGEILFALPWSSFPLVATREGLLAGIMIGARVIASGGLIIFLGVTTPAHEVFRSLLWMKAPREWVEVALLMYRYIFVLIDTALNMATAQRLRLGYSGFRPSLRSVGSLSGMMILHAGDQALRTGEAMVLRGSDGSLPVGIIRPWTRTDGAVLLSLWGLLSGVYGVFQWVL